MIVDYIDAHKARFGVVPICRVLTEHGMQIAPSTYYARTQAGSVSASALVEAYGRSRRLPRHITVIAVCTASENSGTRCAARAG